MSSSIPDIIELAYASPGEVGQLQAIGSMPFQADAQRVRRHGGPVFPRNLHIAQTQEQEGPQTVVVPWATGMLVDITLYFWTDLAIISWVL